MKMLIIIHNGTEHDPAFRYAKSVAQVLGAAPIILRDFDLQAVLNEAQDEEVELLAIKWVGTHKHEQMARQIINQVPCSVLVMKGSRESIKHVLICSGGNPIAEPMIHKGAALAKAANARATLLHVANPVPSMYTGLDAMEEDVEEMLQRDTPESQHFRRGAEILEEHDLHANLELRHGEPVSEILRSHQLHNYDLIVIGASDAAPRLNRLLFENVTPRVVERAPCPVLVVRI